MPAGKDQTDAASAQRTTFRPPWVKEGPNPLPVPTAPWTLKSGGGGGTRRDSKEIGSDSSSSSTSTNNPLAGVQLRKTSITTKEPQENGGSKENTFKRPTLRPVPPKEEVDIDKKKNHKLPPVKLNSVAERQLPPKKVAPPIRKLSSSSSSSGSYESTSEEELDRATPVTRNALVRQESMRRLSQTPAPPPMPPPAPTMPTLFENNNNKKNKIKLSAKQRDRIDQLKKCPKVRPDWTAMLKEIESKKNLKHVECNDRSQPLLPVTKEEDTEHFVFESEKPNVHNELLKQIQGGIKLNRVKTNDRSKPMLDGLRKFRRQMTIEEQIQKSVSMASMPPEEIEGEVDEMDDIDKVRDDLQSTKQMLALELRNKEAQVRENKRLMAKIQNLESDLEKERNKPSTNTNAIASDSEKLINNLKKETESAKKATEEVERKFVDLNEQLGNAKFDLEEQKRQNQMLERKLQDALQGKRSSISQASGGLNPIDDSDQEPFESDLSDDNDDGEDNEEKREKRAQRELKLTRNKLRNFKNKVDNAKKERVALREILKKHQVAMKEEKKKFKSLQKEVDKMAALMKDCDEDEEEEDEKDEIDDDNEEEDEESSSEESSEESSSDSDSERSQSEAEDAPFDKKKSNLQTRADRHEKILGALKKGNFLLKTNAERLQDDLNKQKEKSANLQEDLDSVLAELG